MKPIWKYSLIVLAILSILGGGFALFYYSIPEPPKGDIDYALASLHQASKSNARRYSREKYLKAKAYYDSAMKHWNIQNKRFILSRDYQKVSYFAKKSAEMAKSATSNSKELSKNLVITVKDKIDNLTALISNMNNLFQRLPLPDEFRKKISKGKMLIHEAEVAFRKGDYLESSEKIKMAEDLIMDSYKKTLDDLEDYFNSQPYWNRLVKSAISNTAQNNSMAVIVDKFARKLYIYQNGKKKYEFDAEFGKNWMGRKRLKGDKATPEGIYLVKSKIPANKTKYFRALLLNYPNSDDIENFNKEKSAGRIPQYAQIGGLIEIHGDGGKGTDWTDGCIALDNNDMLLVYKIVEVGTPVVIVGSIADFNTIAMSLNLKRNHIKG